MFKKIISSISLVSMLLFSIPPSPANAITTPPASVLQYDGTIVSGNITAAGTNASPGAGSTVNITMQSQGTVGITVSNTFSANLVPEVSFDGTNYSVISVQPISGGSGVQVISTTGQYVASIPASAKFRVRGNTYTSGTATVSLHPASGINGVNCLNGCTPSTYVASIAAGLNTALSGTAQNPTVNSVTNPSYTAIFDTGLAIGSCTTIDSANMINGIGFSCGSLTSGTFTVPSVNGTVSVPTTLPMTLKKFTPITITDGTNAIVGYVNAAITAATSFTLLETSISQGVSGNTMATGSQVIIAGGGATYTAGSGLTLTGTAFSLTAPVSIANGGTGATSLATGCLSSNGTVVSSNGVTTGCGTVTSVTNVSGQTSVTNGTTTPQVGIATNPALPGNVTGASFTTNGATGAGPYFFSPGGTSATNQAYSAGSPSSNTPYAYIWANTLGSPNYTALGSASATSVGTIQGTCGLLASTNNFSVVTNLAAFNCTGDAGFTGNVHAANFTDSGLGASLPVCTTSGSQLTTSGCTGGTVTNVTGVANEINVTNGTTTPSLAIATNPILPGLNKYQCASPNSTNQMTSTNYSCANGQDIWFVENSGGTIARMTTTGNITTYGSSLTLPDVLALGPDGNLWSGLQANSNNIVRVTPSGTTASFTGPTGGAVYGIVTGPDGNMWFTEDGATSDVVKMSLTGTMTGFSLTAGSKPLRITIGSDGNLWTVENVNGKIVRVTPAGTVTEFSIFGASSAPFGIASGPDGNLWVTLNSTTANGGNSIVKVSTAGVLLNTYALGTANSQPVDITPGPDGRLWFGELNHSVIGAITTGGTITEYTTNQVTDYPITGPDGNIWFSEYNASKIGTITTSGQNYTETTVAGSPEQMVAGPGTGNIAGITNTDKNFIISPIGSLQNLVLSPNVAITNSVSTGTSGTASTAQYKVSSAAGSTQIGTSASSVDTIVGSLLYIANNAGVGEVAMDTSGSLGLNNALLVTGNTTLGGTVNLSSSVNTVSCLMERLAVVQTNLGPCGEYGVTNATFVAPAVGSSVAFTVSSATNVQKFAPLTIFDGTTEITGFANTATTNSTTINFTTQFVLQGSAGNTLATGSHVAPGNAANLYSIANGSNITTSLTNGVDTISLNGTPTISGANITTGTIPDASLVTAPVTNVSAGNTNITIGGTATSPSVALANSISLTGTGLFGTGATTTQVYLGASTQIANQNANTPLAVQFANNTSSSGSTFIGSNSANTVSTIAGSALNIGLFGSTNLLSLDGTGDLGVAGSLNAPTLNITGTSSFGSAGHETLHEYSAGCTNTVWLSDGRGAAGTTVSGNGFGVFCGSSSVEIMSMDPSGDLGIAGSYQSGSLRKLKNNIIPLDDDILMHALRTTKFYQYCYKVQHCVPGQHTQVGYLADDTDTILSGPKHSHIDLNVMSSMAFAGAQHVDKDVQKLDAQVKLMWVIIGILSLGMLILGGLLVSLCKKVSGMQK